MKNILIFSLILSFLFSCTSNNNVSSNKNLEENKTEIKTLSTGYDFAQPYKKYYMYAEEKSPVYIFPINEKC